MVWNVRFDKAASKDLEKLDPQISKRVLNFLFERVSKLENPRDIGEALKGQKFGNLWKYRVGDYRVITDIRSKELVIMVIRVGHRKEVYKS